MSARSTEASKQRLLVFCLDGFDAVFAERMFAAGELPHMAKLRASAARFHLEHGRAKATGLTWEQFATGLAPDNGGRSSAVAFDPASYRVHQTPTSLKPVFGQLDARQVVFDVPYFLLSQIGASGLTCWGSHDPGVAAYARPASLGQEIETRFGPYGAERWIYGFTWPSKEKTEAAGAALTQAVRQRAAIAKWLLCERLADWQVAFIGVSEAHSALEQFWHGVDESHPLHEVDSAQAAGKSAREVYREIDTLVGELMAAAPDAGALLFAMHGMGRNEADVAGMALLPEFMFRLEKGRPCASTPQWNSLAAEGAPGLAPDLDWSDAINALLPPPPVDEPGPLARALAFLGLRSAPSPHDYGNLEWMPAMRYQPYWRSMRAFAFPAFYGGQVRINLAGRESAGLVQGRDFESERDRLVAQIRQIKCVATGKSAVRDIWYPDAPPLERNASEPDMYVEWQGSPMGFDHPDTGRIGPYPWRRPGGHTGERGFAWLNWPGCDGDRGWRSAFDVTPTIFELMDQPPPAGISGVSLLRETAAGGKLP